MVKNPNPKIKFDPKNFGLLNFFKEVQAELKNCVWPTRQETTKLTTIVIIIALAVGFALSSFDYGFFNLFNFLRDLVKNTNTIV